MFLNPKKNHQLNMVVRNPAWKNYKDKCLTPAPTGYLKLTETHRISSVRRSGKTSSSIETYRKLQIGRILHS